jgi:hypothetical protein
LTEDCAVAWLEASKTQDSAPHLKFPELLITTFSDANNFSAPIFAPGWPTSTYMKAEPIMHVELTAISLILLSKQQRIRRCCQHT